MSSTAPTRPGIDRRHTSSPPPPDGQERSSTDRHGGLRSALKHNHVHPEPRRNPFDDDDDNDGDNDGGGGGDHKGSRGEAGGDDVEAGRGAAPTDSSSSATSGGPFLASPHIDSSRSSGGEQLDYTAASSSNVSTSSLQASNLDAKKSNSSVSLGTHKFQRRVGFDTFNAEEVEGSTGGGTGVNYAFTIGAKSSSYCRARFSRTFLCCTDLNEYSVHALDWLLNNLVEDHDEIVVLRVIEPGSSAHAAWKTSMEKAREEAERVLEEIMRKNGEEKQISIIVEFAIGPIEETIHRMVEIHQPDSLIVGTRGKQESLFKPMMGSISKYCVARSPVPVVVVRPEDKVRASLDARRNDPKRQKHLTQMYEDSRGTKSSPALRGSSLERVTTAPGSQGSGTTALRKEGRKEKKGKELKKYETFG